ncbi:hypothetical protein M0804_010348 [Polistes exclamans]|nr:hypothetical protein M0804_010348 [Polistes exclamans]
MNKWSGRVNGKANICSGRMDFLGLTQDENNGDPCVPMGLSINSPITGLYLSTITNTTTTITNTTTTTTITNTITNTTTNTTTTTTIINTTTTTTVTNTTTTTTITNTTTTTTTTTITNTTTTTTTINREVGRVTEEETGRVIPIELLLLFEIWTSEKELELSFDKLNVSYLHWDFFSNLISNDSYFQ